MRKLKLHYPAVTGSLNKEACEVFEIGRQYKVNYNILRHKLIKRMIIMTKIKNKHDVSTLISTLITLSTLIVFPASAGLNASDIQQEDQVNTTKTERIEVLGTKSIMTFRREMKSRRQFLCSV